MKILQFLLIATFLVTIGCQEGYIDEISSVDPGQDESAPTVTLNYPNGDITIPFTETETDIEFEFGAVDDIELQSITISLNGTELAGFTEFTDYRMSNKSYLYEGAPVGNHTAEVTATDLAGKSTTVSLDFEVTNQYVPKSGEIFYMPFEGGVFLDLITETSGTTNGDPGFVNGVSGKAISLSAASQSYMLFPGDAFAAAESFTVSFWVNPDFVDESEDGGIDGVLGLVNLSNVGRFWGNLDFFVENGSNPTDGADMRIHITNGVDSPTFTETWISNVNDVPDFFGNWSSHILTYDNTSREFKYYINGELMTTTAASWEGDLVFQDSGPMVFGCVQFMTDPSLTSATGSQAWASYLTGELDEVRIFDVALSEAEVAELYSSEAP